MPIDEPQDSQPVGADSARDERNLQDNGASSSAPPSGSTPPSEPHSASGPIDRLVLRPPRMWSRGMRMAAMALAFAAIWFWKDIAAILGTVGFDGADTQWGALDWENLATVVFPPLAFLSWVLWRRWDTPRRARAVEFEADGVHLPVSADSRRGVFLAYRDLRGVLAMARGNSRAVLIDTGELTLGYDDADFSPDGPSNPAALLAAELARRVADLPERDEVLARMGRRTRISRVATARPAPATRALLFVLGGYFAVELLTGALAGPLGLVRLGANAPALIEQGQYWRLISGNFLHGGWAHMILNGIALYFLGVAVEKLLGSWRFILIYLVSAILGSVASWLFGPGAMSVGSSTAIFGLFGAFLALHLRYWSQLPPPFRQSKRWWVIIILINGSLPLLVPIIDSAAHIGGMLAGFLLAILMVAQVPELDIERRPARWVEATTGLITALTAAGLIFAGIYALGPKSSDEDTVLASMLEDALSTDAAPEMLNEIAWMLATSPEVERRQLAQARDALGDIIGDHEGRVEIRDTLATVEYRIAHMSSGENRTRALSRAVAVETGVLQDALESPRFGFDTSIFSSQLTRFLAYQLSIGEPRQGVDPDQEPPTLVLQPNGTLEVLSAQALAAPHAIYAVVTGKKTLLGLTRVCLAEAGDSWKVNKLEGFEALESARKSGDLHIEPAWLGEDSGCAKETTRADFWPMSDEIRALP